MTNAMACKQLDELGYVLLPNVMDSAVLNELKTQIQSLYETEGEQAGSEFKQEPGARRLANLVNKGRLFQKVIADPVVLPLVTHVLGSSVKLSSLNARSASPHGERPQPLHCDMGALPDEEGNWVCNAVWLLDDFTRDNGALRVIPGSQRWKQLPQDSLRDPFADHPQQEVITGPAGSVIVMNAHLWHGGQANHSAYPRTAVHAFYCRRDKPQQQYQKKLLDDHVQDSLPTMLRHLLALDDPRNDQLAERESARSGFLK